MSNDCAVQRGANGCPLWTLSPRLALAHELRDIGIDSNCAPMVDVANTETHPFLRNCCYGTDVLTVAAMGRAAADGLLDGGVLLSLSISQDIVARLLTAILICNGTLSERTQVAQADGEMTDIAKKRAIRAVEMRKTPDMIDIAALDAEREALLGGGALAQ